ncbi:hypothetical protein [Kitasatospora sp. NPDC088351]|uniref:hypothetical protein n=1 Tax=Kitasatospora sp. NPDC088351 TaxID=3155180 RepID=UPI00343EB79D
MAPFTPRRRTGAVSAAGLAVLIAIAALVAMAVGRVTPGGLQDHGASQPVTPPLKPQPLWPGLDASPSPASPATATAQPTPRPVPDVTVPGNDTTAVDVRTVLAKDPMVGPEERRALDSCPECKVRSPEYRDLTGDGRSELLVAVATPGAVVLHVYTLADDRVLSVLQVTAREGFSAETVGCDLWLYELTTASARTSSHYHWDGVRLGLVEQKVEGIVPVPGDGTGQTGPSAGVTGPAVSPGMGVSRTPGAAGEASPVPPGPAPGTPTSRPTARPTPALSEAKP